MKYVFVFFGLLILLSFPCLGAQEVSGSLDWDIDTIFDTPPPEDDPQEADAPEDALPFSVKQRGIVFDASFQFVAGISPGWEEAPWFAEDDNEFSWRQNIKMRAMYSLDAQLTRNFRVKNELYFEIPDFDIKPGDFFFDYTLYDAVYLRAGKFDHVWGISPNYGFTNLLARVPGEEYHVRYPGHYEGDSYIAKADIPAGVGGLQLLSIIRANLLDSDFVIPEWRHLGYGAKYNLALRWADFDLGLLYHDYMPFRAFLSIKTTLGNTELYNEWLAADIDRAREMSGAVNVGVVHEFFDRRFSVNGEVFYNGEGNALLYSPETIVSEARKTPFIKGLNLALNMLYRFGGKGNPRVFVQSLYAPMDETARVTPGFRLSPWPEVDFYLAVPLDLGVREGHYYSNPLDPNERHFSVVMLLTFRGSARAAYYF